MSPYLTLNSRIDDVKGDQSWRIFRIISEFTEGFESLSEMSEAVAFLGLRVWVQTTPVTNKPIRSTPFR
jgi:hypothetical protein